LTEEGEVDADAMEEVQRRLEPRAVLLDGDGLSLGRCYSTATACPGGDEQGLDSGAEGIWWVGMSGIEGDGWAASGGRS
jgi:hypothetical protein